jgi:8-oxo-dGTP diphosphatase
VSDPLLYVVRHAKAGSRSDWEGDDALRPLSKAGDRQAAAIARRLVKRGATTLVSSPAVRCVQTLEPLAHLLSQAVDTDERLGEGTAFPAVLELCAELPDGAVMCSHGDVIPELLDALVRRGCELTSPPDWRKASTWVLRRDGDGTISSAKCWPPPDA